MAEALFGQIFVMSVTASLVIAAVILLRLCLRKAPKVFSYALWAVVLFRLICPVSFSSEVSLLGMVEEGISYEEISGGITGEEIVQGTFAEAPFIPGENTNGKTLTETETENRGTMPPAQTSKLTFSALMKWGALEWQKLESGSTDSVIVQYGFPIWLAGLAVMVFYSLCSMIRMRRVLKHAVPKAVCPEDSGQNARKVYFCDLETPFVYGVLRPRIYLPVDTDEREQEYILLHEKIHIRRCDHIIRMLSFLALCIHWFNPIVWLAFFLSGKDMEMSCDEAVLKCIGKERKKEYSASLLSFAVEKHIVGGTPIAFGEGDTKSRIKNILRYRKPTVLLLCAAIILCVVSGIILLANPKEEQQKPESKNPSESKNNESSEQPKTSEASIFGYMGYTGYLDECTAWDSASNYKNCDFDADGLADRVYRTMREDTEFCHYQIEFGNGKVLSFDKDVYDVGIPEIKGIELTGDKMNEILLYLTPGMSNDPCAFGDIVVYERKDGSYQKATLPFEEDEEGYSQLIPVTYEKADGQAIKISIPEKSFSQIIPIEDELWETCKYKNDFTTGETIKEVVWNYKIVQDSNKNQLICIIRLFGKWSCGELEAVLAYENGVFVIEQIDFKKYENNSNQTPTGSPTPPDEIGVVGILGGMMATPIKGIEILVPIGETISFSKEELEAVQPEGELLKEHELSAELAPTGMTCQVYKNGIFLVKGENIECVYPEFTGANPDVRMFDGRLYFTTYSEYTDESIDWIDDAIRWVDLTTLESGLFQVNDSDGEKAYIDSFYAWHTGFLNMNILKTNGNEQWISVVLPEPEKKVFLATDGSGLKTDKAVTGRSSQADKDVLGLLISKWLRADSTRLLDVSVRECDRTYAWGDLDGDGSVEEICLRADENAEYFYDSPFDYYQLEVGESILTDWQENQMNGIYAFSPDGREIILALYSYGPSGDPETMFYAYREGNLQNIGMICSDIRSATWNSDGSFTGTLRNDTMQTDLILVTWQFNESGEIEQVPQEIYDYVDSKQDPALTLLVELEARTEPNGGDTVVLKPQEIDFTRVNADFTWVEITATDGTKGWVELDALHKKYPNDYLQDVFANRNFAD